MGFHEVQFPPEISYGSRGGPAFNTNIIVVDSGAEQRVARIQSPRRMYDVGWGIKSQADAASVIDFFMARLGPANGFRYKDWLDFTTASDGASAYTHLDQIIGVGDGVEVDFQLIKEYTSGAVSRTRNITKPVANRTAIGLNGTQIGGGFSVNTATGIATFTTPIPISVVVTYGGEFDTPVRFVDDRLDLTIEDFSNRSAKLDMIELVDADLEDPEEFPFGGATQYVLNADSNLSLANGRVQTLTPSSSGFIVTLPDYTNLPAGAPYFYLYNAHATNTFEVEDHLANAIGTAAALTLYEIVLGKNSAGNPAWYMC